MKFFSKIILFFILSIGISINIPLVGADENINIGDSKIVGSNDISLLNKFFSGNYFKIGTEGEYGIYNLLIKIAKDAKNLFFFVSTIYFLILVFKLISSGKSDEELTNFKKGIIWITIGLIVMQTSFSFVVLLYDRGVSENLAYDLVTKMILPLVKVIETGASFFFITMAIYSFYRLVTASGNEESIKSGKMTIIYSIVGFIVIKFSRALVEAIYGRINCQNVGFYRVGNSCIQRPEVEGFSGIITTIINWANGFIGVITVLMIIYAGYNILFSGGNEEMLKKSKSTILYVAIGIFLLITNYIILTFFIFPDVTI